MNAVREHRQMSFETLDEISGAPKAYWSKTLGPMSGRRLTMESLGMLFGSLAIKAVLIEDPEQLARIQSRMRVRNAGAVRNGAVHVQLSRRHLAKIGRIGGTNSRKRMTRARARELGKRAALI